MAMRASRRARSPPAGQPAKKRGTAATPQPALPSRELIYELPQAELVCGGCDGDLHKMVGQFEGAEMIDVVVEYHVKKVLRQI
jgi:hypothetical protein